MVVGRLYVDLREGVTGSAGLLMDRVRLPARREGTYLRRVIPVLALRAADPGAACALPAEVSRRSGAGDGRAG